MRIRRLLALTLAATQGLGIGAAWANPLDGLVVSGRATFNNNGNVLTIVNAPGTIINWGSFNIAGNETTRFVQQGASSAVLNRITGQDPSRIFGALESNGHVFLVNPNGVVFGAGSRVDVNGLIASSLDIGNDDFRAGRLKFAAGSANPGAVRNEGAITTPSGGRVYLIAPSVENTGLIASPQGEVVLAAGREVQLVDSRNPDLHVVASAPADRAMNLGRIISQGGSVGIYGALINQRGVIDADSAVVGENGRIVLRASDTTLLEAGSQTTARGAGDGGSVHVLGDHVGIIDDASVDASGRTGGGTVLVGGDYRGLNPAITNASAAYVGAQASIRADATDSGNGGRVIVYSSGATRAYGHISARGGAASGNGGFAEVSGASYLDYRGRTDLRASNGTAGTLLLDPNDITIQAAGASTVTGTQGMFQGGPASSILTTADLVAQLGMGSVTVSTSGGSGGPLGGHITVANAISWTGGALTLDADNGISINGAINNQADGRLVLTNRGGSISQTAPINTTYLVINSLGDVNLDGATNNVSVVAAQVGDATHLNHNLRFLNGASFMVSSLNGVSGISIATSGAYSAGSPDGVVSLRTTSGDITQLSGSIISAKAVNVEADHVTLDEPNNVGVVSGQGASSFSFTSQGDLTVGSVGGRSGVTASGGDVALSSSTGSLVLANAASAPNGSVNLTAYQGGVSGSANGLSVTAWGGNAISLTTQTQHVSAFSSAAASGITINNTGPLTVDAISNAGSGAISVTTSGPLTVSGITSGNNGAVTLSAGPTGNATDDLTVNGNITTQVDSGGAIETGGPVLLRAGDTIAINGTIAGNVTQQAQLNVPAPPNLPTVDQCIANPSLGSCAQVLPSPADCVASPGTHGCIVVLPSIVQCTSNPQMYGCSAVLPSVAACIASPSAPGCSVVLPTLAQCAANPALAGCVAVLPSQAQCIANAATPGCASVLPTLASCVANPALAGCQSVLPTLSTCIANPSQGGCQAVLPTLASCVANSFLPGCQAVLPSLATCVVNPGLAGCQAVLPPLAACVANPAQSGCQAVLPTLSSCVANPTQSGCATVLPSLAQCIASPSMQGCAVVLPALAQCVATPTLAGCTAVLPTADFCSSHPTDASCGTLVSIVGGHAQDPITQTINNIISLVNSTTNVITTVSGATGTGSTTGGGTSDSKTADKTDTKTTDSSGAKNEKPATKLYCN